MTGLLWFLGVYCAIAIWMAWLLRPLDIPEKPKTRFYTIEDYAEKQAKKEIDITEVRAVPRKEKKVEEPEKEPEPEKPPKRTSPVVFINTFTKTKR